MKIISVAKNEAMQTDALTFILLSGNSVAIDWQSEDSDLFVRPEVAKISAASAQPPYE